MITPSIARAVTTKLDSLAPARAAMTTLSGRFVAAEVWAGVPSAMSWSVAGAVLTVRLTGAVDASLYPGIELLPSPAGCRFERVELDLTAVSFFGAAGLSLLARLGSSCAPVGFVGVPERSPIRRAIR